MVKAVSCLGGHNTRLDCSSRGLGPYPATNDVLCLLQLPTQEFNNYDNSKHYVYLQAVFPNKVLEKVVLLSFQSEYLFIQTDKNVYTPKSRGTAYVHVGWVVQ